MKLPDFSNELGRLMDPCWRKARIAARLLIKREEGKAWSARDRRLAQSFAEDHGVTNRLVDQAMNWHKAPYSYGDKLVDTAH
jgi:cell wall-associated NlpC family hydrolase